MGNASSAPATPFEEALFRVISASSSHSTAASQGDEEAHAFDNEIQALSAAGLLYTSVHSPSHHHDQGLKIVRPLEDRAQIREAVADFRRIAPAISTILSDIARVSNSDEFRHYHSRPSSSTDQNAHTPEALGRFLGLFPRLRKLGYQENNTLQCIASLLLFPCGIHFRVCVFSLKYSVRVCVP